MKANDIVRRMSIKEKAMLVSGGSLFSTKAFPELGIDKISFVDCASGINLMQRYMEAAAQIHREENDKIFDKNENPDGVSAMLDVMRDMTYALELREKGMESEELSPVAEKAAKYLKQYVPGGKFPTCFPDGMMLGASWDREAVYDIGRAVGKEAAAYHIDVLLGSPNINIHRDPRNGRLFEGFSEDPHLVSELAPELIKGIQDQHVMANVKHYAANNQETRRIGINEHISRRTLEEIYLPGFRSCVQNGKVRTLMAAYNTINDVPCSHDRWLLRDKLRDEWNFEGMTVCDWGGNYDMVKSLEAGIDLNMPGPRPVKCILDAVESGDLEEAVLDEACTRIVELTLEVQENRREAVHDFSIRESSDSAYHLAAEAVTLLKNENVLPLKKGTKIAFFGEKSKKFLTSGDGSALVITDRYTSLYEEVKKLTGDENVTFEEIQQDEGVVIITAGCPSSEGVDHDTLSFSESEKQMIMSSIEKAHSAKKKIVFILNSGNPMNVSDIINDIDAFLWVYFPGQEGGKAVAEVLFGDINPSGKLPLTYPVRYQDCPSFGNFPGECDDVYYGEGIFVGYRWYEKRDIKPLYPFGHGLSYTVFSLSNIRICGTELDLDAPNTITVSLDITNTGSMDGADVVQLYIADTVSSIPKPVKELKHFEKVHLKAGEKKTITFKLTKDDFESYHPKYHQWDVEPGNYVIEIGDSSDHIVMRENVRAKGHSMYDYGADTWFSYLQRDERAYHVIRNAVAPYVKIQDVQDALFFTPFLSLQKVWDDIFAPKVRAGGGDENRIFNEICSLLREIDVGENEVCC